VRELAEYFLPATGDLYREDAKGLVCYPSISRRANRQDMGACSKRGELIPGPRPAGGVWFEVDRTAKSFIVSCQSMREAQVMRCHARLVEQEEHDGASF